MYEMSQFFLNKQIQPHLGKNSI